jgi:hypothetical protein
MEQGNPQSVGTTVTVGDQLELPNWLTCPDPKPPALSKSAKELLHLEYQNMFEHFIEQVYRGRSLKYLVEDDHRLISYEDFLRWVKRDPQRNERFKEAQEMRTEFLAGEILEIADNSTAGGEDGIPVDVNWAKLQIDTRKWLMSAHNKKRYGETKQIELNATVSARAAMEAANARIADMIDVIDVTPRLESD